MRLGTAFAIDERAPHFEEAYLQHNKRKAAHELGEILLNEVCTLRKEYHYINRKTGELVFSGSKIDLPYMEYYHTVYTYELNAYKPGT